MIITYKTFTFELLEADPYRLAIVEAPLRLKHIPEVFFSRDEALDYITRTVNAHLDNFGGVAHQFRNKAHDKIEIYPHRTAKGEKP